MVVNLLTLSVIGGLASRVGPFFGAAIIVLAPQFLTGLQEYETLIYGVGLLLFIIFLPRGIAGLFERNSMPTLALAQPNTGSTDAGKADST
jgi:branched-chain amino acid transport system permease protein